jgi:hypothetical protein
MSLLKGRTSALISTDSLRQNDGLNLHYGSGQIVDNGHTMNQWHSNALHHPVFQPARHYQFRTASRIKGQSNENFH